jgi:hypothetical protein
MKTTPRPLDKAAAFCDNDRSLDNVRDAAGFCHLCIGDAWCGRPIRVQMGLRRSPSAIGV